MSITVLMTVYNGEAYLQHTLENLLNQTDNDFDVLIVDDCSSDRSVEIIEAFNDSRIHLHKNPENIGQTRSLNVGLKLAKGEYIARMDADDLAYPEWLANQKKYVKQYPDYAAISTRAVTIDEVDKITKILRTPLAYEDILLKNLISSPINHVGICMKKDVALQLGGYDESFKIAADYALWSKMLLNKFKIATNPKIGVAVRHHSQSISQTEHNTSGLSELSQIIHNNINQFTNYDLSMEDADVLRDCIYSVRTLSQEELEKCVDQINKIYTSFKEEYGVSKQHIQKFVAQTQKSFKYKQLFRAKEGRGLLGLLPMMYNRIRLMEAQMSLRGRRC